MLPTRLKHTRGSFADINNNAKAHRNKQDEMKVKMVDILSGRLARRSTEHKPFELQKANRAESRRYTSDSDTAAGYKSTHHQKHAGARAKLPLEASTRNKKSTIRTRTNDHTYPKYNNADIADTIVSKDSRPSTIRQSAQRKKSHKESVPERTFELDEDYELIPPKKMLDSKSITARKNFWDPPMGPEIQQSSGYVDNSRSQLFEDSGNNTTTDQCLLEAGPFGIGEAKACLDDLQATLLSYYNKLYRVDPDVSLDWQINQLGHSFYPSPYPISGNADLKLWGPLPEGTDLAMYSGRTLPPLRKDETIETAPVNDFSTAQNLLGNVRFVQGTPPDNRDAGKAVIRSSSASCQNDRTGESSSIHKNKDNRSTIDTTSNRASMNLIENAVDINANEYEKAPATHFQDIINELYDMSANDSDRLDKLLKEVNREVGDPTSVYYYRGGRGLNGGWGMPRGLQRPIYCSQRLHLNELQDHVETLQRNLAVRSQWNQKKIRLLEDRIQLMKSAVSRAGQDPRSGF